MPGTSSRERRVAAVKAAQAYAYGKLGKMPEHFDDRQKQIFDKYVLHWQEKIARLDSLMRELESVYGNNL